MPLSKEEVEHIGRLARVGLTDEDIARFQEQLSDILEYFEALSEVNTDDVPPTTQSLQLQNVEREDVPKPSYPKEQVLANAPQQEDGYFRVRAVLE